MTGRLLCAGLRETLGARRGTDAPLWHHEGLINHTVFNTYNLNNFWPMQRLSREQQQLVQPGVEGQQLGVDQDEGVQHLLACSLCTAVELLHQAALQELDALLAQGRVDESLHCLSYTHTHAQKQQSGPRWWHQPQFPSQLKYLHRGSSRYSETFWQMFICSRLRTEKVLCFEPGLRLRVRKNRLSVWGRVVSSFENFKTNLDHIYHCDFITFSSLFWFIF